MYTLIFPSEMLFPSSHSSGLSLNPSSLVSPLPLRRYLPSASPPPLRHHPSTWFSSQHAVVCLLLMHPYKDPMVVRRAVLGAGHRARKTLSSSSLPPGVQSHPTLHSANNSGATDGVILPFPGLPSTCYPISGERFHPLPCIKGKPPPCSHPGPNLTSGNLQEPQPSCSARRLLDYERGLVCRNHRLTEQ